MRSDKMVKPHFEPGGLGLVIIAVKVGIDIVASLARPYIDNFNASLFYLSVIDCALPLADVDTSVYGIVRWLYRFCSRNADDINNDRNLFIRV